MAAEVPDGEVVLPPAVAASAAGQQLRLVWQNELGGQTYEVGTGAERRFVKWTPAASGIDVANEVIRLAWAANLARVPRVLDHGTDELGAWIITAGLPGENAVTDRWKSEPAAAVIAIGQGLRALHDELPVDTCPFSWSVEHRLVATRQLAELGRLDPTTWDPIHQPLGIAGAFELLREPPSIDKLVVCHGDACAPNTLLTDDGQWSGHVDLGALGVADRWADIAVATWSTEWNYGPGWENTLLGAYGIAPDAERTRFYRLLWDIGDASDVLRRAAH
jgi:aminoglycoside phosphotransferase